VVSPTKWAMTMDAATADRLPTADKQRGHCHGYRHALDRNSQ